jgi:CRP-like cAMP-binding protein
VRTRLVEYAEGGTIFSQGEPATSVMYVQSGAVRLSFLSRAGAQRIVAILDGKRGGCPSFAPCFLLLWIYRTPLFRAGGHVR